MSKRPAIFEVLPSRNDKWYYHERYGKNIKNVSQMYGRKSSAVRAARREAEAQGSRVEILG